MYDQIAKLLWKGAVAVAVGAAAWYADKKVKEKTGKHIHEHAADFVKKMWSRLKNWAANYLSEHPRVRKVYTSAISVAAAIKRAKNAGENFIKVKVFGAEDNATGAKVILEEEVPLEQADNVLQQAKEEPILAMRV
jgi:hypothetical protein